MIEPASTQKRSEIRNSRGIGRQDILVRLIDQGLWSAAFFAFNLVAASFLNVADFASLTVCSSIGVILAAAVRAYAVDGRVIAGSRSKLTTRESVERRSVFNSGLVGAGIAAALSLVWLSAGGSLTDWWLPVLAGAIVLADGPHYSATMYGLFIRAAFTAGAYVVLASVAVALKYLQVFVPVGLVWVASLVLVWVVGLFCYKPIPWTNAPFRTSDVAVRLSGESLYSALGGQLGILVIFLTSPPDDTAGIRLAYSLVFAPVFMIIQGLSPLFLSKMAQLNVSSRKAQFHLLNKWVFMSAFGVALSGLIGALLSTTLWKGSNFEHVMPFLIPVGASMIGSVILDSALLLIRFRVDPKITHRMRLSIVTVEAATQTAFAVIGGSSGLVTALIIGFAIKVMLGAVIFLRNRTVASAP
jgi:hypothetical protein